MKKRPVIYIGYDVRDDRAFEVAAHSIRKYNDEYDIIPLREPSLRRIGLYRRASRVFEHDPKQRYDVFDGKPFSTDFTFTRFLVPALQQYEGLALFMDADMLIRADIAGIFEVYGRRTEFALQCVKHKYQPDSKAKMDGVAQTRYHRKNWSSFMLFNCSHPSNAKLTVDAVNLNSGSELHSLDWLRDDEIGDIHEEWNWLDGHSSPAIEAKNVHFTTGGPWFQDWKPARPIDEAYAEEWDKTEKEITTQLILETL
jgi:lipopolysaccharide biosynthesis glycosyltransferase